LLVFNGPKDKTFAFGGPTDYMINMGDESKTIYLPKPIKLLRKENLPVLMEWTGNGFTLGGKTLPHPTMWGTESFDPDEDNDFGASVNFISFEDASPTKKARTG
jgi:hypothetical protein